MKFIIEKAENILAFGGIKKDIVLLVISFFALGVSLFYGDKLPFNAAWIAIILCGVPIISEAVIGLVTAFDIKADVLVSLALIASVFIGEDFAAGEIAFIMQIGALLEDLTVAKARAGIERLVNLTPRTARRLKNNSEETVSAESVKEGDILRVLAGETIPVDGIITLGQTSVNQAVMTGEAMPADKGVGDEVYSGTVNQFGTFEMRATKVGEDSSIQRMIKLVQSADAGKTKIVRLADRWATWIVVIALTAAFLTWLATGEIIRSVTILVVFCPCALVLATPTAVMAAIGNATRHGFLVREGDALERLAAVNKIAFDKTGTLTVGKPKVIKVRTADGITEKELYEITAAAESLSEHPLGKAVAESYRKKYGNMSLNVKDFEMIPGRGISAAVDGKRVIVGNKAMLADNNIVLPNSLIYEAEKYLENGNAVIYTASDGKAAGFIVLADTLREGSLKTVEKIKALGIQPVLLTGDAKNTAQNIAVQLSIEELQWECMPEDKLNKIAEYQSKGEAVCMIGDGINDAPALKLADASIAMGGIGSDIAVNAADITLVDDKVEELPHILALSKRMMHTIRLNLTFSMLLNFIAIVLAISGILNPVAGALVHNAGSVMVIINSALLLKWRFYK